MGTTNTEFTDPPNLLCLSMTVTEDKILRELYRCDGCPVTSGTLCVLFHHTESVDNIYGALVSLHEMGYIEADVVKPWVWVDHYRVMELRIAERGRHHVRTTKPVRTGWLRVFLSLVLVGMLLAGIESFWRDPDLEAISSALMTAGVLLLALRRAGKILITRGVIQW